MTVSSDDSRDRYEGNDSATTFDFNFYILADSDLQVVHTDSAGTETVLVLDTDYSVTDAGNESGGSITYPLSGSPLTAGEYITLSRSMTIAQPTDLRAQRSYSPTVIERALDRIVMFIQQLNEKVARQLAFPVSEDRTGKTNEVPSPEDGKVLGWSDGELTNVSLGAVTYDLAVIGGDAGKVVVVNGAESGIEVGALPVSSAATASTIASRDANGRIKVADPSAAQDAVSKAYLEANASGVVVVASGSAAGSSNVALNLATVYSSNSGYRYFRAIVTDITLAGSAALQIGLYSSVGFESGATDYASNNRESVAGSAPSTTATANDSVVTVNTTGVTAMQEVVIDIADPHDAGRTAPLVCVARNGTSEWVTHGSYKGGNEAVVGIFLGTAATNVTAGDYVVLASNRPFS